MTSEQKEVLEELDKEEIIDYLIEEAVLQSYPAVLDQFDKGYLIN